MDVCVLWLSALCSGRCFFVRVFRRLKRGAWGSVPIPCSSSNKSVRGFVNVSRIPRAWGKCGLKNQLDGEGHVLLQHSPLLAYMVSDRLVHYFAIDSSYPRSVHMYYVVPLPHDSLTYAGPERQHRRCYISIRGVGGILRKSYNSSDLAFLPRKAWRVVDKTGATELDCTVQTPADWPGGVAPWRGRGIVILMRARLPRIRIGRGIGSVPVAPTC